MLLPLSTIVVQIKSFPNHLLFVPTMYLTAFERKHLFYDKLLINHYLIND